MSLMVTNFWLLQRAVLAGMRRGARTCETIYIAFKRHTYGGEMIWYQRNEKEFVIFLLYHVHLSCPFFSLYMNTKKPHQKKS